MENEKHETGLEVSGSATRKIPEKMEYGTHTLVMIMNNLCNLECSHCYLQYNGNGQSFITPELIDAAINSSVKHLVIAGKESFVNDKSAEITRRIVEGTLSTGKTVSIISNGINIPKYLTADFPRPTFIDVILDGGPESYRITRHNKTGKDFYPMALAGAKRVLGLGIPLNILNTIHSNNVRHLDDLMTPVLELNGLPRVMFSPYIVTRNDGTNNVSGLKLERVIEELSQTQKFMDYKESCLFLDPFTSGNIEGKIDALSDKYGMREKVKMASRNQIAQIMRFTYDGLITTPQESIHPSLYGETGCKFNPETEKLDDALERIRRRNVAEIFRHQSDYQLIKSNGRLKWAE